MKFPLKDSTDNEKYIERIKQKLEEFLFDKKIKKIESE